MDTVLVKAKNIYFFIAPDPPAELKVSNYSSTSASFSWIPKGDIRIISSYELYQVRFYQRYLYAYDRRPQFSFKQLRVEH